MLELLQEEGLTTKKGGGRRKEGGGRRKEGVPPSDPCVDAAAAASARVPPAQDPNHQLVTPEDAQKDQPADPGDPALHVCTGRLLTANDTTGSRSRPPPTPIPQPAFFLSTSGMQWSPSLAVCERARVPERDRGCNELLRSDSECKLTTAMGKPRNS